MNNPSAPVPTLAEPDFSQWTRWRFIRASYTSLYIEDILKAFPFLCGLFALFQTIGLKHSTYLWLVFVPTLLSFLGVLVLARRRPVGMAWLAGLLMLAPVVAAFAWDANALIATAKAPAEPAHWSLFWGIKTPCTSTPNDGDVGIVSPLVLGALKRASGWLWLGLPGAFFVVGAFSETFRLAWTRAGAAAIEAENLRRNPPKSKAAKKVAEGGPVAERPRRIRWLRVMGLVALIVLGFFVALVVAAVFVPRATKPIPANQPAPAKVLSFLVGDMPKSTRIGELLIEARRRDTSPSSHREAVWDLVTAMREDGIPESQWLPWLREAAGWKDFSEGARQLGLVLAQPGRPACDPAEARALLSSVCAQGLPSYPEPDPVWQARDRKNLAEAQAALADLLMTGRGGSADMSEAVRLYSAAGEVRADACVRLARIYAEGRLGAPDAEAAKPWLARADRLLSGDAGAPVTAN